MALVLIFLEATKSLWLLFAGLLAADRHLRLRPCPSMSFFASFPPFFVCSSADTAVEHVFWRNFLAPPSVSFPLYHCLPRLCLLPVVVDFVVNQLYFFVVFSASLTHRFISSWEACRLLCLLHSATVCPIGSCLLFSLLFFLCLLLLPPDPSGANSRILSCFRPS